MGREEASIPGVVAAVVFAFGGTVGHFISPERHDLAWLCMFVCAFATFFASIKTPDQAG